MHCEKVPIEKLSCDILFILSQIIIPHRGILSVYLL